MARLYWRVYLALFLSLLLFALLAMLVWHRPGGPVEQADASAAQLVANFLPPPDAPAQVQQAALARMARRHHTNLTLLDAHHQPLASIGRPLKLDHDDANRLNWSDPEGGTVWLLTLPDGRLLLTSAPLGFASTGRHLLMILLLLVLAVSLGAYPVVRRLTKRLERLQAAVESLGAGDLAARVPEEGRDEVARLAASFNRAAGRIEDLVGAHKRLLAHASHELRTPLTRIRLALALSEGALEPHRREGLQQDIAELDALIDEILLASRLDTLEAAIAREPVDWLPLVAEECARFEQVAFDGTPAHLTGDPRLLRRLVRNLLDNARKYGQPPTVVTLAIEAGQAVLRVSDAGPGVPLNEREQVFEPFYRRSTGSENIGAGLGLALVRQIARLHGGEARCEDASTGGSEWVVCLPSIDA
jgi:signal transduction histidine kinase